MRTFYMFLAVVIALLLSICAYAAPVGNPTEPAFLKGTMQGKFVGFGNMIVERELDKDDAKIDGAVEWGAKLAYNFSNKVEVYGIVGGLTDLKLRGDKNLLTV